MAIGLRLTDGITTLTLSDGTLAYLEEYNQPSATEDVAEVTDRARLTLSGTLSTNRSTVVSIRNMLRMAAEWQAWKQAKNVSNDNGRRVFVERDLGDGTWWRSELVGGALLGSNDALDKLGRNPSMSLVLVRKNWWEGAQETAPLTNPNGTNVVATTLSEGISLGLPQYHATLYDSYVEIASSVVTGDLPAPAVVEYTVIGGGFKKAWLGLRNLRRLSSNKDPIIFNITSGGTNVADTDALGDAYRQIAVASGTETVIASVQDYLYDNNLKTLYGQNHWHKLLICMPAMSAVTTPVTFRVKFYVRGVVKWQSEPIVIASDFGINELATLRWPPVNDYDDDMKLEVTAKQASGSSLNVNVDYLYLFPIDGYRAYKGPTVGSLLDDAVMGFTVDIDFELNERYPEAISERIHLIPGVAQRLHLMLESNGATATDANREAVLWVRFRPRRLVI